MSNTTGNRLEGKVAIITGGATGIGEAVGRMFARQGARVVLGDIADAEGEAVAASIGLDACLYVHADIAKSAEVQAMVDATIARFGRIDILVNNAGIIYNHTPITEQTEQEWDHTLGVNLTGAWLATKFCFPHMKESGGSIINISSIAAVVGNPNQTAYGASKGGLLQLTRHCAAEGAAKQIRVNCISPAGILTKMALGTKPGITMEELIEWNSKRYPIKRPGMPDDVAHCCVFLASEESGFITGQNIVMDGGLVTLRV